MPMLNPGDLRHRVTIQQGVEGDPTSSGQRDLTWQKFSEVWAEVKTLSGRELEKARTLSASVTHTIHIRYLPGVIETYRVLWGTRILAINAIVDPENRRFEQFLYCTEEIP